MELLQDGVIMMPKADGFEEDEAEQAHHPSEDDFYLSSDFEALLDKRHVVE
ncbi:MAG: hypothetical protein FYV88_3270, partial [Bacteroidetes bacterium]|nr:hypothetical protein [Bacteroidota bacterium]